MTIKNGDLPAMPQDDAIWCQIIGECPTLAVGLSKRELMAMHMMAAMLSKHDHSLNEHDVARDAVRATTALLAALESAK